MQGNKYIYYNMQSSATKSHICILLRYMLLDAPRVPPRRTVSRETVNSPDPDSLAGETTSEDFGVTMAVKDTPSKANEDDRAPVQTARVLV